MNIFIVPSIALYRRNNLLNRYLKNQNRYTNNHAIQTIVSNYKNNFYNSYMNRKKQYKMNREIMLVNRVLSIPYPLKPHYTVMIPPNIFQTWHSKTLPPLMYRAVQKLRKDNPMFKYYLYDDVDCREFIENNYQKEVLDAYDSLIPGAYKADLWRYCILYKYGGIYLDIKYIPVKRFNLINLTEKEYFCLDMDNTNIYNAIIVSFPGNETLYKAIQQIVTNVKNKNYGNSALDPTGPGLLANYFTQEEKNNFELKHKIHFSADYRYILLNGYYVFQSYPGYINEHNHFKKVEYYGSLWNNRNIYK